MQNNRTIARLIIAGIFVLFAFKLFAPRNRHSSTTPPPTIYNAPSASPSPSGPPAPQGQGPVQVPMAVRQQIEQRLKTDAKPAEKPGIAVAILVDTSGSMNQLVPAADGKRRAKMQIAHESVLNLIRMTEKFATDHPEKPTLLGVYEFSGRGATACRNVIPLGPPKAADAERIVRAMRADGNTPIGEAIITAKRDLDASGVSRLHIMVVTDGENTQSFAPGDVLSVMSQMPDAPLASVYFVAFDVAAGRFNDAKSAGALVLSASNEAELQETVSTLLTGRILVE